MINVEDGCQHSAWALPGVSQAIDPSEYDGESDLSVQHN